MVLAICVFTISLGLFALTSGRHVDSADFKSISSHSSHDDGCVDTFDQPLRARVAQDEPKYHDFEVPGMSSEPEDYLYALEKAFIVLPEVCASLLDLAPNVGDSNGVIKQWMGRSEELMEATDNVKNGGKRLNSCACGWVIFLHGSGGFTYDNSRFAIMMATMGYGVLVPDSFAAGPTGFRYKAGLADLDQRLKEQNSKSSSETFWCENNVYEAQSSCIPAMIGGNSSSSDTYPLCYSTSVKCITSHREDWKNYYERVYRLREMELKAILLRLPPYIAEAHKFFLAGESEGGMVAARFSDAHMEGLLARGGRMIFQWSCEYNYYVSCAEHSLVAGSEGTPVLSMIADEDPYFSMKPSSIAVQVAEHSEGYSSKNLTGNCHATLKQQGFRHATSVVMPAPYHGLIVQHQNLVRATLQAFMARPWTFRDSVAGTFGPTGAGLCNVTDDSAEGPILLRCKELGDERLVPGSEVATCAYAPYHMHRQYHEFGTYERCALPDDTFLP